MYVSFYVYVLRAATPFRNNNAPCVVGPRVSFSQEQKQQQQQHDTRPQYHTSTIYNVGIPRHDLFTYMYELFVITTTIHLLRIRSTTEARALSYELFVIITTAHIFNL